MTQQRRLCATRRPRGRRHLALLLGAILFAWPAGGTRAADNVPAHAQGLVERLLSVPLPGGAVQQGVLSMRRGATTPTHLALLLPGSPSIVRAVVEGDAMVRSSLTGNFLIRARRHLVSDSVATLIVDCRSDRGPECSAEYQASAQRYADVRPLIALARNQVPTLTQVWLIGTSLGTVSSAYLPVRAPTGSFAGALHTATITEPERFLPSLQVMVGFDYRRLGIPQAFVHHVDDSCRVTPFRWAQRIGETAGVPVIAIAGSAEPRGDPCQAFSQHGFIGVERSVMVEMHRMILNGVGESRRLQMTPD